MFRSCSDVDRWEPRADKKLRKHVAHHQVTDEAAGKCGLSDKCYCVPGELFPCKTAGLAIIEGWPALCHWTVRITTEAASFHGTSPAAPESSCSAPKTNQDIDQVRAAPLFR